MSNLYAFVIFWGVWILVPMLVDGTTVLLGFIGTILYHQERGKIEPLSFYPLVTIIIPVYNCENTLRECLLSVVNQSYPKEALEIMVVDNGSRDRSFEVFQEFKNYGIRISWHSITGQGKSWALNSGVYLANGQYVINIDCDLELDKNAIINAISHLENNKNIGAATGYLVIKPPNDKLTRSHRYLARLEFLEYCTVFGVGRSYQTYLDSIFTLSGAFSIFRKEVLLKTLLYNKDTVSEDTELTFQIYSRAPNFKISAIPNAIAFLHPIESWSNLYSQRVRWQRGQLEVAAMHSDQINKSVLNLKGVSATRALLIDHTLALPRLVWTSFLPILVSFGYPPQMLFSSYIALYLFYIIIEVFWIAVAWLYAETTIKRRLLQSLLFIPLMPFYRIFTFIFRVAGFFNAIYDPFEWNVPSPVDQIKEGLDNLESDLDSFLDRFRK